MHSYYLFFLVAFYFHNYLFFFRNERILAVINPKISTSRRPKTEECHIHTHNILVHDTDTCHMHDVTLLMLSHHTYIHYTLYTTSTTYIHTT